MVCRVVTVAAAAVGLSLLLAAGAAADLEADLAGTELLYTYVVFRHGDRTPEAYESAEYPNGPNSTFYPWDLGQLTNIGKKRAYGVGQYLQARYGGFLDPVYLPSQIKINCTDLDRTKMTALSALAALYPPTQLQRWNAQLLWQPIPFSIQNVPSDACSDYYDDLVALLSETQEVKARVAPYSDLFEILSNYSGADILTPTEVLMLQGAVQGNQNYGFETPAWYEEHLPQIEEVVNLWFELAYYTDEIIRTYSGPLLNSFLEAAQSVVAGADASPRVRILSAHDTTVAGMLAAAGVFTPHRPQYGAAFSLELRNRTDDGVYVVAPVYKVGGEAGEQPGAAQVLRVPGCGDGALCPLDTFVQLTESKVLAPADVVGVCSG